MNKKLFGYAALGIVVAVMIYFALVAGGFSGEQGAGRADQAIKSSAPTSKPYSAVTKEKALQNEDAEESDTSF